MLFLAISTTQHAHAFGGGGGGGDDDGGGDLWMILPNEQMQDGQTLAESFAATDAQTLRDQRFFGTLCQNQPCGSLSETQAKDWLDTLVAAERNRRDRQLAWGSLIVAILGFLLALAALIWTIVNDRRSRVTHDRAIRTEVKVAALEQARHDDSAL